MDKRNIIIDIARGIAIILVVVGHSGVEAHIRNGIYFFHMPLFFFISGMFFKPKDSISDIFRGRQILRVKKLYLPFVANMFLLLTLSPILHKYLLTSTYITSFSEWIENAIIILRFRVGCVDLLGHYWFLPVLFWGNILSLIITFRIRQKSWIIIISFILFVSGYTLCVNYDSKTPYDYSRIMYYTSFYLVGYCCADKLNELIRQISSPIQKTLSVLFCLLLFITFMTLFANTVFNNAFLYLLVSIAGIIMLFCIAAILNISSNMLSKIFDYIGRHTMVIFTWHVVVFKIIEYSLAKYGIINMSEGWNGSYNANKWWWLYTVSGVVIPVVFYMSIMSMKHIVLLYGKNH